VIILASDIPVNSVSISLTNLPHPDYYQVYLLRERLYEEKHSQRQGFPSYSHPAELTFRFKRTFKNVRRIRFDLGERAAHHIVTRVDLSFHAFNSKIHLAQWPLQEFASQARSLHSISQIRFETNRLHIIAGGEDPHFDIPFNISDIQKVIPLATSLGIKLILLIILGILAFFIYYINIIWRQFIRLQHWFIDSWLIIIRHEKPIVFAINRADELIGSLFSKVIFKHVFFLIFLVGLLLILIGSTPFNLVLREDAYSYVNKAMECTNGDFSIVHFQSIGWPLFLGCVFFLFNINDLFSAMFIARFVSIACTVFCIIPIYWICKKLTKGYNTGSATTVAIIAFISNSLIHFAARNAITEPLFLILSLICGGYLITDKLTKKAIVLSSVFASLAYYVRPNGLFLMGIILVTVFIKQIRYKKIQIINFGIVVLVFFAVSAPHLVARWSDLGSPFDYGPNSKYFVDHYEQVWAPNIKSPTFFEYLKTHSNSEIYEKFVIKGVQPVLRDFSKLIVQDYWMNLSENRKRVYVFNKII
jgi:hypothetical protein